MRLKECYFCTSCLKLPLIVSEKRRRFCIDVRKCPHRNNRGKASYSSLRIPPLFTYSVFILALRKAIQCIFSAENGQPLSIAPVSGEDNCRNRSEYPSPKHAWRGHNVPTPLCAAHWRSRVYWLPRCNPSGSAILSSAFCRLG